MKLHFVVIGMILWTAGLPGTGQNIVLSEPPGVSFLTGDSVTIRWETTEKGSTEALIGRYPLNRPEFIQNAGSSTSHSLTLPFRHPSELVRVQAFSVTGNDTARAPERLLIAPSASSGQIRALFTSTVDTSASLGIMEAEYLPAQIDDELIRYIDQSEESIDMAIYDLNTDGISDITAALNRAYDRGVTVCVVCDGNANNYGLETLHPSIGKIASPPADYPYHGLMDNKFVVFDARSEDPLKPVVWTGSANFTDIQINLDPNNVVIIQDQSLAIAYQMEFNEMYGSEGRQPNPQLARFGPDKYNNTPHEFVIGGRRVECYFSPSDGTEGYILSSIGTADVTIEAATMLITILPILQEDVRLNGEPGLMHHKYMIVDQGGCTSADLSQSCTGLAPFLAGSRV